MSQFKQYKADKFREMWGKHAGWAQTVMFVDDLREFKLQKSKSDLNEASSKIEPIEKNKQQQQIDEKQPGKRSSSQNATNRKRVKTK